MPRKWEVDEHGKLIWRPIGIVGPGMYVGPSVFMALVHWCLGSGWFEPNFGFTKDSEEKSS